MRLEANTFKPAFVVKEFWEKAELLWQAAQQLQLPAALYSLPGSTQVTMVIGLQGLQQTPVKVESLPPGFQISPFVNGNGEVSWFFEADLLLTSDDNVVRISAQGDGKALEQLAKAVAKTTGADEHNLPNFTRTGPGAPQQKEAYVRLVNRAIEHINQGKMSKVIASRTQEISFDQAPSVVGLYVNINQAYPNAFISAVMVPGQGIWLGASPELLAQYRRDGYFKTVALAGTQHILNNNDIFNAVWKEKERDEQQNVVEYIEQCFVAVGEPKVEKTGPKTVPAGNLMHLCTDFVLQPGPDRSPDFASQLIKSLHPTSAVCGMPRKAALDFVYKEENYDRQFYCGFLGPVNINGESNLYVNLRCMQLNGNKATLYAGAGITAASDPEQEWLETELKCQTLLNVLQNIAV